MILQCCSWQYESDKYTLNIDVNGGGSGYYITNGKAIPVTWKKDSTNAPARYYDADGNEITMNQGKHGSAYYRILMQTRLSSTAVKTTLKLQNNFEVFLWAIRKNQSPAF